MIKYLKDEQHYIDCYDLHTIEECLGYYRNIRDGLEKKKDSKEFRKFSRKEFDKEINKTASYIINILKAKRYERKKEMIQKWMGRDRNAQEIFDNAVPTKGLSCKGCSSPTEVISKDLKNPYDENSKVMFMFECLKCKKRQAFYENGTERQYKKPKCPECDSTLNGKSTYVKNVLTTDHSCPNCSYKNEEVDDFNKSEKRQKEREVEEKKLLEEYRKEFCVSDKVGEEMLRTYEFLSRLYDEFKEKERKNRDPLIQQARQLKTLTVVQLQKHIAEILEKEDFTGLKFGKPEIGKHVIVDFSVFETKDNRKEYESQKILKKIINRLLQDTSWRLMSDGIHYRLGILTGRLKAYEREEDLVKILKKK